MSAAVAQCDHCDRPIWWNGLVWFHDDPNEGDRCPGIHARAAWVSEPLSTVPFDETGARERAGDGLEGLEW